MSDDRILNHKIQIVLSIITFGLWLPVYLITFLVFKGLGSTIGKRKESRDQAAMWAPATTQTRKKGYQPGKSVWNSSAYQLECGHLIRAKTTTRSANYLKGRTVFCEICNEERGVVGIPRMN